MKKSKREKLKKDGFAIGSVQDFLGLSDAEMLVIEVKKMLAKKLREKRNDLGLSQVALAKRLRSAQPSIARMEAAAPEVSLDFMFTAAFELGVTAKELAKQIASPG